MNDVLLFVALPAAGVFLLVLLSSVLLQKFELEKCGPPRKASALSQAFFSEEHVLRVAATFVILTSMSVIVAYRTAAAFAYTAEPVGILASALAVLAVVLGYGACWRQRDFPSTRVRLAICAYFTLLFVLMMVPEILQSCSHHGCWYPPFERQVFGVA